MKKPLILGLLVTITSFLFAQKDSASALSNARGLLEKNTKSISAILSDSSFDFIRSDPDFRQLINHHAKNSFIKVTAPSEPGTKISVNGKLIDKAGNPVKDGLVYVYQTDSRGWYGSDRPHFLMREGDRRHARLFGYFKTSSEGNFELETIQPKGYPQSDLPGHIHLEVFDQNNRALIITELLFDDDERLTGSMRDRSLQQNFAISKPIMKKGRKIYNYTVQLN